MKGFFTPTEPGSVGTFAVILLSTAQRGLNVRGFATKVPFGVIYRGVVPFLAGLVLCAALLFAFPQLATLLPSLLMK